jgi:RHS repeat-associated protein
LRGTVATDATKAAEAIGAIYYYHSDHLGSSNVVTDQAGAQVQYCEYAPYGSLAANSVIASPEGAKQSYISHFFTGKELDATGLYYYGARYYDPEIGRFISADTIVQAPFNPQTLNRYSYCGNNPINYVDPTGHIWNIIVGAVIGAIIGGISAAVNGTSVGAGIGCGAIQGAFSSFGAIGGAVGGVIVAAINGGNIGVSALAGGVGGLVGGVVGGVVGPAWGSFWGAAIGGMAGGAAGGAVGAGMTGGNVWQGAAMGAAWGVAGAMVGYGVAKAFAPRANQANEQKVQRQLKTDRKPEIKPGSAKRGHYLKADNTNAETGIRTVDELYVNDGDRGITVIGARQDTLVAKGWPNHNVLDLPRNEYTWQKNIGWLDGAINRNDIIYMATNPEQCTGTYGQTYLKEIYYLESKGYVQNGNYMIRGE